MALGTQREERSEIKARHLMGAAVGVAGVLSFVGVLTGMGGSAGRGDLNCDGRVNGRDIAPFVLAVRDPGAWCRQYGRDLPYLLSIADFNQSGRVDIGDIPGFAAELKKGLRGPEGGGDSLLLVRDGNVDLDIDSDNDHGSNPPGRTPEEDGIEDDPFLTGKQIQTASAAKAVLEFVATGQIPLPSLTYRLAFPGSVSVAVPAFCEHTEQPLTSYGTYTYPYPKGILGDMNGDGAVNDFDIDPFILALVGPNNYCQTQHQDAHLAGDFTGDWVLSNFDIDPFIAALGQPPQPIPIRLLVSGLTVSGAQGETRLYAQADSNGDGQFDAATETDAVRTTVWDGATLPPPAELGAPRPWGASLAISAFSTANVRNGNVLTTLPLASWDPVGPPVAFTLYHNSQAGTTDYSAWGFDLGGGWSVSYGAHVEGVYGDAGVVLVGADGRRDLYLRQGNGYIAPGGVHDLLTWNAGTSQWTLTSPDLTKASFDGAGRLLQVQDASGNIVTVGRDPAQGYRIAHVKSAADDYDEPEPVVGKNRLEFVYYTSGPDAGRLLRIIDPIDRSWVFEYTDGRLWRVHCPTNAYWQTSFVEFAYDGVHRIADITSRDSKTWTYTYADGKVTIVRDPQHDVGGGQYVRYEQRFAYAGAPVNGLWDTTYTDRRGYTWVIRFDTLGNARELRNPLDYTRRWEWDSDHNAAAFVDELSHRWTATYGPVGNRQTLTSPLPGQTWTWSWDHPVGTPENFYRLTQVTDPAGHWAQYVYDHPIYPTWRTRIIEPQALPGDPYGQTTTQLEYYGTEPEEAHALGQRKLVIDGNGVHHWSEYDKWGYPSRVMEGLNAGIDGPTNSVVSGPTSNDGVGRPKGSTDDTGANGSASHDPDNNPTEEGCWYPENPGGHPPRLGNVPSPQRTALTQCLMGPQPGIPQYDITGRPMNLERCIGTSYSESRSYQLEYDDLGRPTKYSTFTNGNAPGGEPWGLDRTFHYLAYDADARLLRQQGPDGGITEYTFNGQLGYDELGRPKTGTRGGLSATFFYDPAGRVERLEYANGAKVIRHYDDASRLEWIEHRDALSALRFRIDYAWNLNNTLQSRTEFNGTVTPTQTAVVTFQYDDRDRLIHETRVVNQTQTVYDIAYTYDGLGNRLEKTDSAAGRRTCYVFDTDWDPVTHAWRPGLCFTPTAPLYETRNNRLLEYREYPRDGQGGWGPSDRAVRYTYYKTGHVSNITVKDAGPGEVYDWSYDLSLYYATNGSLWCVLWDKWKEPAPGQFNQYTRLAAREFYFDSHQARYLDRDVEPNSWAPLATWNWTDYGVGAAASGDGPEPYGDFTYVPNGAVTEQRQYLATFGVHAQQTVSTGATRYLHGDLIRSTMLTTDQGGTAVSAMSYTAFGEPIGDPSMWGTRYQYAGGWGYESGLLTLAGANPGLAPVGLLHVGARWYQPNVGRFVQRDPIGLSGGLNVYAYTMNRPSVGVDPEGLLSYWGPRLMGEGADMAGRGFRMGSIGVCIMGLGVASGNPMVGGVGLIVLDVGVSMIIVGAGEILLGGIINLIDWIF